MRYLVALLLLLSLQFVPGAGVSDAMAQQRACSTNSVNNYMACSREEAVNSCLAAMAAAQNIGWQVPGSCGRVGTIADNATQGAYRCQGRNSYGNDVACPGGYLYYTFNFSCPPGGTWNDTTKKCVSPFDGTKCSEQNALLGINRFNPRPSLTKERCIAVPGAGGFCSFKMDTTGPLYSETTAYTGEKVYRGVMEYTGLECGAVTQSSPEGVQADQKKVPRQECVPVAGQSMCIKADGHYCQSASNGRQICWRMGETGEKTDGPVIQIRKPGSTPSAPSTPPPPGTEWVAQGDSVTTTTTTATTTATTTTNNYTTNTSTEAGAEVQGEGSDGTGAGDGEGSDNAVNGDGSCEGGWLPSGDPLLAAIVVETNRTRCGNDANSEAAAADADAFGAAADALEAGTEPLFKNPVGGVTDGGFVGAGSGTCPTLPEIEIGGAVMLALPEAFCTVGDWLRWLFVSIAYVWAFRIILE